MRSMVEGVWEPTKRHAEFEGGPARMREAPVDPLRLSSLATSPAGRGRSHVPPTWNGDFVQGPRREKGSF
jgi:hypothetical protein